VIAPAALVAFALTLAPGDGSGRAMQERVAFNVAADGSVVEALRAHLAPDLAARNVDLDVTPVAAIDIERVLATAAERTPGAPLARAWLDGRDPRVAILFLIPRQTDRVLVRKVPLGAGFDAVALAEIAYIVERAVASLLAAEPIGVAPAEARAALAQVSLSPPKTSSAATAATTVATPAPAASAPARVAFDGSAFAGVSAWAPGASAVLSVGLALGAERVGPATRVGLLLAVAGRQSFDVASSPTGVHVSGGDVHLFLTAARTLGHWGTGRLGIGPSLVIAHVEPVRVGSSATETIQAQPRTDADPAIAAVACWDFPLGRLVRPFIAATVDVVPVRGAYTAIVNGASRTLLAPWPVRPGLLAGVAFGR
jgi:hypothetical protein